MRISDWSSDVCSSDLVILSKVNAGPVEELVRPLCSSEMSMQRPRWSRRRFQHRDLPLTKSVAASSPGRSGLPGHWHPGEPGRQDEKARHPDREVRRRRVATLLKRFKQLRLSVAKAADRRSELAPVTRTAGQNQNLRSEEHTSELQSLMSTSYAVFCSK